jgi:Na+-translocating ferredoxin:NAD+ oxidoreductase RnfD subunit
MLQLAPHWVTGMPALFSGYIVPSIVFGILGMITVIYAKQLEVSLSWLFGFIGFAFVRAFIAHSDPLRLLLPIAGPSFLLFTFHMISDPATTPQTRFYRVGYGFLVALLDAGFRFYEIPYGMFYSLFFVCGLMPWIREQENKRETLKAKISSPVSPSYS